MEDNLIETEDGISEILEVKDLRDEGRFYIHNDFFDNYVRILGTNALGVYCSLCRYANGQRISLSQKRIAEELGLSVPTVNEWIKVLEYFRIIKKQRIGKALTNRYWLLDRKRWRNDWQAILDTLKRPDFNLFKTTTQIALIQNLTLFIQGDNSKAEKEIKKKNSEKSQHYKVISDFLEEIKKILDIPEWSDTARWNRIYAQHCLRKFGREETLKYARQINAEWSFGRKPTKMKTLYYGILHEQAKEKERPIIRKLD